MKRPMRTLLAVAVMLAAGSPAFADDIDLKKIREIAVTYDKFTHTDADGTWEKGEVLPTAKAEDEKAWQVEGGTLTIDKEGMKLVGKPGVGCDATLSKKTLKGPVGIRYEAMTPVGAEPCDLSVQFGPAGRPTMLAFAFGGYANNENFFRIGKQRKVLPDTPLITAGQWYTVEFLVHPDKIVGKVDDKVYGKEKLPAPVREDAEHDVTLYVWGTTGIFRNVRLLKYVPPKADGRTWEEVMGKVTKEELKALAGKVGPLLGDDAFAKRQAAEEILFMLRPLSDEAVKEQLKSADPEVQVRARKLAERTGMAPPKEAAATRPAWGIIHGPENRLDP